MVNPCMLSHMPTRGEFERIRTALSEADPDEPLTAREIRDLLAEQGVEIESSHRVATVLGRWADAGEVDVIHEQPYRYRFTDSS